METAGGKGAIGAVATGTAAEIDGAGAAPDAVRPAIRAEAEASIGAAALALAKAGRESSVVALEVRTTSVVPGDEEKKEPTLLVLIGSVAAAAESRGRERRAAREAGR